MQAKELRAQGSWGREKLHQVVEIGNRRRWARKWERARGKMAVADGGRVLNRKKML